MNAMKKCIALLLSAVLLCSGALALAEGTLRVGMECDYAPYNWTQAEPSDEAVAIAAGGYADGYDVRIAKRVAEALGMELEIVKTEWDGLVPSLTSGMIDCIIAGMSPTEERKATIDFSDPYYEDEVVMCIVVRKDGAYAGATSLADFAGAKITGQLNTFHYGLVDQVPDVQKQTAMPDFPAMITALSAGAIDGYISELPGAVSATSTNPDLTYVTFEEGNGFALDPGDVAIAVGIDKKNSELTEKINAALAGISNEERGAIMEAVMAVAPTAE